MALALAISTSLSACRIASRMGDYPPVQEVTGVVVAVSGSSIAKIDSFSLRTNDGRTLTFIVDADWQSSDTLPPVHLREHMASGEPVLVKYVDHCEQLTLYSYEDAST